MMTLRLEPDFQEIQKSLKEASTIAFQNGVRVKFMQDDHEFMLYYDMLHSTYVGQRRKFSSGIWELMNYDPIKGFGFESWKGPTS